MVSFSDCLQPTCYAQKVLRYTIRIYIVILDSIRNAAQFDLSKLKQAVKLFFFQVSFISDWEIVF